jgi:hypothetical protein
VGIEEAMIKKEILYGGFALICLYLGWPSGRWEDAWWLGDIRWCRWCVNYEGRTGGPKARNFCDPRFFLAQIGWCWDHGLVGAKATGVWGLSTTSSRQVLVVLLKFNMGPNGWVQTPLTTALLRLTLKFPLAKQHDRTYCWIFLKSHGFQLETIYSHLFLQTYSGQPTITLLLASVLPATVCIYICMYVCYMCVCVNI